MPTRDAYSSGHQVILSDSYIVFIKLIQGTRVQKFFQYIVSYTD